MSHEPEPCCFDDWAEHYGRKARRRKLGAVSEDLLAGLETTGLDDRTMLDVGCGAGGLLLAAVDRGAARVVGLDLSRAAIDEARAISTERGLAGRTTFEVADGAVAALPPSDVVVLDKVFCCYPDVDRLLENSLGAARNVYGFSVPPSEGIRGAVRRGLARMANRWYRLRRRRFGGFQTYVHDVGMLDTRVRAAGFERRFSRRRFGWDVAVYERDG